MTRFGNFNSHMVFKSGEQHLSHYETPYGSFTIGIISDDVKVKMDEEKADISIKYLLEIDNAARAEHEIRLSVHNA